MMRESRKVETKHTSLQISAESTASGGVINSHCKNKLTGSTQGEKESQCLK